MNSLISRYATPLTLGLFAVSTISGLALFFHVGQRTFHGMHEWLSVALLVPFIVHVWKNWPAMMGYFKRRTVFIPLLVSVIAAAAFAVPAALATGPSASPMRIVQVMVRAPLADVAPILKTTPDAMIATLAAKGYAVDPSQRSLAAIAANAGVSPLQLVAELMPAQ